MTTTALSLAEFLQFQQTAVMEGVSTDAVEREYVFFGTLTDPTQLEKALRFEDQTQYRILLPSAVKARRETSVRIRQTVKYARNSTGEMSPLDAEYTLTIKSFLKGEPGNVEGEVVLDPLAGAALLAIFKEEGNGMVKRRYFFPVTGADKPFPEGTFWEVDVFLRDVKNIAQDRGVQLVYWPYVKLDFEVRDFDLALTPSSFEVPFPVTLSDVVYGQPHDRTPEEVKRVATYMQYMTAK